ncbi:MAG: hypothetical protein HYZ37_17030 [Candidatus Solibacter usitatus]|nr:hypothetical protein [Candidatus Solibacter usitatus]
MRRRTWSYWMVAMFLVTAAQLPAHENFRIIGTATKVQATQVDVKTKDRSVAVRMDKQTKFLRDGKKVAAGELKAGQSVVVEAYGDSFEDLLAIEVRIVPPIRQSK